MNLSMDCDFNDGWLNDRWSFKLFIKYVCAQLFFVLFHSPGAVCASYLFATRHNSLCMSQVVSSTWNVYVQRKDSRFLATGWKIIEKSALFWHTWIDFHSFISNGHRYSCWLLTNVLRNFNFALNSPRSFSSWRFSTKQDLSLNSEWGTKERIAGPLSKISSLTHDRLLLLIILIEK